VSVQKAVGELVGAFNRMAYSSLARRLTGNDMITVEWRPLEKYRGLTFKRNGLVVIQVSDDLDPDQELKTVLHEIAHAKLHASGLAEEGAINQLPEKTAAEYPERYLEKRREAYEKRECEARDQVDQWLNAAGDGSVKDRIMRLLKAG